MVNFPENIKATEKQVQAMEDALQWIEENIPTVFKLSLTDTSIDNGKLVSVPIVAVFVNCSTFDAAPIRKKVFEYNAEHKGVMLRVVASGQEDCFTDLAGGKYDFTK